MKIVQSVSGKFHHFHLARQLYQRGMLESIFSSYPRQKLRGEGIPANLLRTFPYVHLLSLAGGRFGWKNRRLVEQMAHWDRLTFDRYVSRHLPECDVFVGLSGSGLLSGRTAQGRGSKYVCDRGSSHIRYWDQIMREEFRRWGQDYDQIDPRNIAEEEDEYAQADLITVPSEFACRSFVEMGVPRRKLRVVAYGADLQRFSQVARPSLDTFDVLYVGAVSFLKGIPDLLEAFRLFRHPRKRLTLVGEVMPEMAAFLQGMSTDNVEFAGRVPHDRLKEIMSRSHVLVFPSLNDGFGMVIGEAMACGCPVICSENCGGADFLTDGREGFIVPTQSSSSIAERLERLAQDPELRELMSLACLIRVGEIGGWDTYGAGYVAVLDSLVSAPVTA